MNFGLKSSDFSTFCIFSVASGSGLSVNKTSLRSIRFSSIFKLLRSAVVEVKPFVSPPTFSFGMMNLGSVDPPKPPLSVGKTNLEPVTVPASPDVKALMCWFASAAKPVFPAVAVATIGILNFGRLLCTPPPLESYLAEVDQAD